MQKCGEETTFDGEKADLWAAGITLLQIMKNLDPFQLFEMPGQFELRIARCDPGFFQEKLERFEELQKAEEGTIWWVIKGLLDPFPTTHITAQRALEAPCFRGLNKSFQAKMFEDLKRGLVSQSTRVPEEEVDLSNYGWMANATRAVMDSAGKEEEYESQAQRQKEQGAHHYVTRPESYLLTPVEGSESYLLSP